MTAQVIEGKIAEVQQQLMALPLTPNARLRIVVTEIDTDTAASDTTIENAGRRNGLILIPTRPGRKSVTTDLINELSED